MIGPSAAADLGGKAVQPDARDGEPPSSCSRFYFLRQPGDQEIKLGLGFGSLLVFGLVLDLEGGAPYRFPSQFAEYRRNIP